MRNRLRLVSALFLFTWTLPAAAQKSAPVASASPPLADSLRGEARAEYDSGKLLFGDGDFAGALVKFQSAHERSGDARLLWNMAACEKNQRRYSRALRLIRRYLSDSHVTADDRREAEELIGVMEPFTSKLRVEVDEPGAEVWVDDELLGTSPVAPYVVDIGTRRLRVRKSDFAEVSREIAVGGSVEMKVDVRLERITHEGRLVVRAPPDATVALDGRVVGSGSWSGVVPSGGHMLRVTAPKMRTYQSDIFVQDNQRREVAVTLEPEGGRTVPPWVWIAGGLVATGALATGGYLLVKSGAEGSSRYDGPSGNLSPGVVQASRPVR